MTRVQAPSIAVSPNSQIPRNSSHPLHFPRLNSNDTHQVLYLDSNSNPWYPPSCLARLSPPLAAHSFPSFPTVSLLTARLLPAKSNCPSLLFYPRVPINLIPRRLALVCFHTLTHSFASVKLLTSLFSTIPALFAQNTGGGVPPGILILSTLPHSLLRRLSPLQNLTSTLPPPIYGIIPPHRGTQTPGLDAGRIPFRIRGGFSD